MSTTNTTNDNAQTMSTIYNENPFSFLEAILVIYEQQTLSEQETGCTQSLNGVGFNGIDSNFATDVIKKYILNGKMPTKKQLASLRFMMRKYAGQLIRLGAIERIKNAERVKKLFQVFTDTEINEKAEKLSRGQALDFLAEQYKNDLCNEFMQSLYEQYNKKQCLSEKQWYYLKKNVAKDMLRAGL